MYVTTEYAQSLRAIGQALETLNIEEFELEPIGEDYRVRGVKSVEATDAVQRQTSLDKLRSIWGGASPYDKIVAGSGQGLKASGETSKIELNYTREDIERLNLEGQAKRGDSEKMADSTRLAQLLRCIGAYLAQKLARLVKVTWQGDALTVEYETSMGSRTQETFAPSDLYDFGVRMYLQRASRGSP